MFTLETLLTLIIAPKADYKEKKTKTKKQPKEHSTNETISLLNSFQSE